MNSFSSIATEIGRLRDSPNVEVLFGKSRLSEKQTVEILRPSLERAVKVKVSSAVAESLWIDDDLHVYWKSRNHRVDEQVFGEFFLRSALLFAKRSGLSEVFLARKYDGIDLGEMRLFDQYAYNGGPIHALLRVNQGRLEDQVYIFDERDVFRTDLTYEQYLQVLRVTRGFLFWQYLYCQNAKIASYNISNIEQGLNFIEREFPGDDYTDLRRRLSAIL